MGLRSRGRRNQGLGIILLWRVEGVVVFENLRFGPWRKEERGCTVGLGFGKG